MFIGPLAALTLRAVFLCRDSPSGILLPGRGRFQQRSTVTTGTNVSPYVKEFHLAKACERLGETEKSMTEIMAEVGIHSKSDFSREFRRVTDKSGGMATELRQAGRSRPFRRTGS